MNISASNLPISNSLSSPSISVRNSQVPNIFACTGPLTEIVKYLDPFDVGRMMRVCKKLYESMQKILLSKENLPQFLGRHIPLLRDGKCATLGQIRESFAWKLLKNITGIKNTLKSSFRDSLLSLVNTNVKEILQGRVYTNDFKIAAVLLIKNNGEMEVGNDCAEKRSDLNLPPGFHVALGVVFKNAVDIFGMGETELYSSDVVIYTNEKKDPDYGNMIKISKVLRPQEAVDNTASSESIEKRETITVAAKSKERAEIEYPGEGGKKNRVSAELINVSMRDIDNRPNYQFRDLSEQLFLCLNSINEFVANIFDSLMYETTREIIVKFASANSSQLNEIKASIMQSKINKLITKKEQLEQKLESNSRQRIDLNQKIKNTILNIANLKKSENTEEELRTLEEELKTLQIELSDKEDDGFYLSTRVSDLAMKISESLSRFDAANF